MSLTVLKKMLIRAPFFVTAASWFTKRSPRVFMYHRFCGLAKEPQERVDGLSFREQLGQLKEWKTVTLGEYLGMIQRKEDVPPYLVIITVDDGYEDFFIHAYPQLKELGIKATFFPAIDFMDGKWLWWDRINYALEKAGTDTEFTFNGRSFSIETSDMQGISRISHELSDFCVMLPDSEKWKLISELEEALGIVVPSFPTPDYRAAKWEQLSEMSRNGVEIGAHTITHPILSKISETDLNRELKGSRERLEKELGRKVTSFCYPNGMPDDLGEKVFAVAKEAGFMGAVVSYNSHGPYDAFRVPRMSGGRDMDDFLWKLCGMETLVLKIKKVFRKTGLA